MASAFLPLGDALTVICPELLYYEAKRQYEALKASVSQLRSGNHSRTSSTSSTDSMNSLTSSLTSLSVSDSEDGSKDNGTSPPPSVPSLSQYYRDLFDDSTKDLDETMKYRLLTICFAYKTKENVLMYLALLDEESYPWAPVLREVVKQRAKNSALDQDPAQKPLVDDPVQDADMMDVDTFTSSPKTAAPVSHDSDPLPGAPLLYRPRASVSPSPVTIPYFIITTLPLAFSTTFFQVLASLAPLTSLTIPKLLCHPAAMLLTLSPLLTRVFESSFPDFWKSPGPCFSGSSMTDDEIKWIEFFNHLMEEKQGLVAVDGEIMVGEGEVSGLEPVDLGHWVAGWYGVRQGVGMREVGMKERARVGFGVGGGKKVVRGGGGGSGSDGDDEGRMRRVRFRKVVDVREIPGRRGGGVKKGMGRDGKGRFVPKF